MLTLTLSANAAPRVGGQGLNLHHMIEGLRPNYELSVYCRPGRAAVPLHGVPPSRTARWINSIPVVRRLRDWQVYLEERHFDQYVAPKIGETGIFQGVTGQCLESLRTASRDGALTVLDVISTHIDDYHQQAAAACAQFGVRAPHTHRLRERMRQEYKAAHVIRVMSEHARQTFLRRGFSGERIHVLAPPIDVDAFPEAQPRDDGEFRVVFAGLLEPAKGFHYLIRAFRNVRSPGMTLRLWGSPGARPVARYMREQMHECPDIQLEPGSVSVIGPGEVYGKSDVLVMPSLADGFGYVVAEAMACGIPVIVTNTTGAAQWVEDGVHGYIVPPADTAAIADCLEYLRRNPELARRMGKAARQQMRQLTMERFQSSHAAMIAGVFGGRAAHV